MLYWVRAGVRVFTCMLSGKLMSSLTPEIGGYVFFDPKPLYCLRLLYAFLSPSAELVDNSHLFFPFRLLYLLDICAIDRVTGHCTHSRKLFPFLLLPWWFHFCRFARRCFSLLCSPRLRPFLALVDVFFVRIYFWGLVWIDILLCNLASAADTEAFCGLFLLFVLSSLLLLVACPL